MQMISCGNEKVFWSKSLDTPFQCWYVFWVPMSSSREKSLMCMAGFGWKKKLPLPYAYFFIPHFQHSKRCFLIVCWFCLETNSIIFHCRNKTAYGLNWKFLFSKYFIILIASSSLILKVTEQNIYYFYVSKISKLYR